MKKNYTEIAKAQVDDDWNDTRKIIYAVPYDTAGVFTLPVTVIDRLIKGEKKYTHPVTDDVTVITYSECGKMEPNRLVYDEDGHPKDVYRGPMVIIGGTKGNFRSLTETEIIVNMAAFGKPDFKEEVYDGDCI